MDAGMFQLSMLTSHLPSHPPKKRKRKISQFVISGIRKPLQASIAPQEWGPGVKRLCPGGNFEGRNEMDIS
jgi:hypothetical protein